MPFENMHSANHVDFGPVFIFVQGRQDLNVTVVVWQHFVLRNTHKIAPIGERKDQTFETDMASQTRNMNDMCRFSDLNIKKIYISFFLLFLFFFLFLFLFGFLYFDRRNSLTIVTLYVLLTLFQYLCVK